MKRRAKHWKGGKLMQTKKRARGPGRPQALTGNPSQETSLKHDNRNRKKLPEMQNPAYRFYIDEFGVVQYRKKK